MVDLSSCYFCGAAMDVSLREYPVIPDALAPTADEQETVVLCGTCQRKLGRVLEPVVDVATTDHTTPTTDSTTPTRAERAGVVDPDGVVTPAEPDRDDATPDDAADELTDDTADEPTDDTADDATPFEVDDTASVFDDDDGTDRNSIFADDTTTIPNPENTPRNRDGTELGDALTFSNDASTDDASTDDASTDDGDTSSDRSTSRDASTRSTTDSTNTQSVDDHDVDPKTYNKVVRLLKNRDLPVSRAEIEDVAGSAYAIPDSECEAIIDAAVTRGLVAERDGNLVHPDGV